MQLLESIRFENGIFSNLTFHESRMNSSRKVLFNRTDKIGFVSKLQSYSDYISDNQIYKCRIIYDSEIRKVEFIPYQLPKIGSLKLVANNDINYDHKYLNREKINQLFEKTDGADDIIIVKNGLVTDSSFANLLFFNGKNWLTPTFPLLKGTQRAMLLQREQISTADIHVDNLHNFIKVRLINAMLKFEDEVDVLINQIR